MLTLGTVVATQDIEVGPIDKAVKHTEKRDTLVVGPPTLFDAGMAGGQGQGPEEKRTEERRRVRSRAKCQLSVLLECARPTTSTTLKTHRMKRNPTGLLAGSMSVSGSTSGLLVSGLRRKLAKMISPASARRTS